MPRIQRDLHASQETAPDRHLAGLPFPFDTHVVRQVDGLHHHLQFVVSVRAFSQHVQDEIYFCFCL